ncbi:DUF1571 domain-containing protein [Roseiconus nitratireducens]|nr:DUF1571 domain-containing protein [Roseiconus nitratireducens]
MSLKANRSRWLILTTVMLLAGAALVFANPLSRDVTQDTAPTVTEDVNPDAEVASMPRVRPSSIAEVLQLAGEAKANMSSSLEDYTTRFVKQERNPDGKLSEKSEMSLKVQTRMRNESDDAPMRIYMKFARPESSAGREVIWGGDLYDGNMAVHENTMLLSWKTLWLDPDGMLAMNGQRYPIYEIGLVRLVEKLIERGSEDVNNPDVSVTITRDHEFDSAACELIRVTRQTPSGREGDFSLAEVVYDPERLLILSYRSFGWPDAEGESKELPLLESYEYRDLKTNVGLSEQDFDVSNPEYQFP